MNELCPFVEKEEKVKVAEFATTIFLSLVWKKEKWSLLNSNEVVYVETLVGTTNTSYTQTHCLNMF